MLLLILWLSLTHMCEWARAAFAENAVGAEAATLLPGVGVRAGEPATAPIEPAVVALLVEISAASARGSRAAVPFGPVPIPVVLPIAGLMMPLDGAVAVRVVVALLLAKELSAQPLGGFRRVPERAGRRPAIGAMPAVGLLGLACLSLFPVLLLLLLLLLP